MVNTSLEKLLIGLYLGKKLAMQPTVLSPEWYTHAHMHAHQYWLIFNNHNYKSSVWKKWYTLSAGPVTHHANWAWCGVVWCGVVWCGVVWCGVVWWFCDKRLPSRQQVQILRWRGLIWGSLRQFETIAIDISCVQVLSQFICICPLVI